ncbi:hypothetical protein AVEN_98728-1 [Araneus ventricosus]|uniref:Uncharacterized protein n=1 Tax=Araneus ventricosus TaxID=182803 RepID=A0A4Y2TLC5_ARAVE|nr:hypothetical protein AVEN_98728-1 [Araneus ventricosus]
MYPPSTSFAASISTFKLAAAPIFLIPGHALSAVSFAAIMPLQIHPDGAALRLIGTISLNVITAVTLWVRVRPYSPTTSRLLRLSGTAPSFITIRQHCPAVAPEPDRAIAAGARAAGSGALWSFAIASAPPATVA